MKKINLFTILSLVLVFHLDLTGQTSEYSNFLDGLVSAYALESPTEATDALGLNHGSITGATTVEGTIGNALAFEGSQATMVIIPSSPSLDLNGTETTFMVDIYPTANGQSGVSVLLQKGWGNVGDNVYSVSYNNQNKIRFRNHIDGVRRDFISTTTAPLNTWSRILCVWKSGEPRVIRINTATDVEGTTFTGTQSVSPDKDFTIGSYDVPIPAEKRSFVGRIDNVMIWNRALTTEEQNILINENLGYPDFTATPDPDSNVGSESQVWSTDGNTAYYSAGNVAVGTTTVPDGFQMAVDGKLITEEVKVQLSGDWPDYVLAKGYELPTLQQVEEHIKEKGHLINIPSASEVEANGMELGDMNKLLLEKIEELTLYILQQERQQKRLDQKTRQLEKQIQDLNAVMKPRKIKICSRNGQSGIPDLK